MVLVTGAGGMIGRAVAAKLRAAGKQVRAHSRTQVDFSDASSDAYDHLVRGCDAIVHCAALVHWPGARPELYEALNVRPTRMLAAAAARNGVRSFIFLSTIGVYGPGPFERISEDAATRPATPYALSKLRAEEELAASPIDRRIILRPALVFGEGDRGNMLALIRLIDRGLYRHVSGNAQKSLICALDLASAIQRCLERLPRGNHVFNVANAEPTGVSQLANVIARCLGRKPPHSLPHAIAQVAAALIGKKDALRSLSTTTTCSTERLGYAAGESPAMPLSDALALEIRWARATGLLRASA